MKVFTAIIVMSALCSSVLAQKVIRKGMPPLSKTVINNPGPLFDIDKMGGKWQEVKRVSGAMEIPFTDSLLLFINKGNSFVKNCGDMSMIMRGEALVQSGNVLNVAGSDFYILKADAAMLTLRENSVVKYLKPVSQYYFETVGKDSVPEPVYKIPVEIMSKNLAGSWDVYRRRAEAGFISDTSFLVQSISFSAATDSTGNGSVVTYTAGGQTETLPFSFTLSGGTLTLATPKGEKAFSVYKADGAELVFGRHDGVLTFAKPK